MFLLPTDDLPAAVLGPYEVAFTGNGAFVVSKDGRWLFDGGLSYAMAGSSEWGTQVRRSSANDRWHLEGRNERVLITDGTLFDTDAQGRFQLSQRAEIIAGGLRFVYEVSPLERRTLHEFGVALHFPVAEARNARTVFWPGHVQTALPRRFGQALLHEARAQATSVYVANEPRVAVVAQRLMDWRLYDGRQGGEDTYRLVGRDAALVAPLSEGKTVAFSFDVLLGSAVAQSVDLECSRCEVDRLGRLTVCVAKDRLVDGGLMLDTWPPRWLHVNAEPDYDVNQDIGEAPPMASGITRTGDDDWVYEVELSEQEKRAVAVYRVYPAWPDDCADKAGNIRVGFLLPRSAVVSFPTLEAPMTSEADDAAKGTPLSMVQIGCGETTVELGSDSPWSVVDMNTRGSDYLLVSTETHRAESGVYEAQIRISTSQTGS